MQFKGITFRPWEMKSGRASLAFGSRKSMDSFHRLADQRAKCRRRSEQPPMSLARFIAIASILAVLNQNAWCENRSPFWSMYDDPRPFLKAIRAERLESPPTTPLTGITVPHHLVAADLIARGFWAASASPVDRVIMISPDHFFGSRHPFATSSRDFMTVFGLLRSDNSAVSTLLADVDEFEDSQLFTHEHGIAALLPFVVHFFPRAKIIPIVISPDAKKEDWDRAVSRILPLFGSRTLIVQSTDFSHYLSLHSALERDQETLNVLSTGKADAVMDLRPSDHLDSKGAQYIQMRLQSAAGAGGPVVVASRNSYAYSHVEGSTTSYNVQLYAKTREIHLPPYKDQQVIYFGGDVLLGRFLSPVLLNSSARRAIVSELQRITGGQPLVINLEGFALDETPAGMRTDEHLMPWGLAAPILKSMNVLAASLANNHSFDVGQVGLDQTSALLQNIGIKPVRHDEIIDLGKFRLLGLNFVPKRQIGGYPSVRPDDLAHICRADANPPLIAFVHWGEEYTVSAGSSERATATRMLDCGITAIIGAHSHRASTEIEVSRGGMQQMTFSLGNLLFDQNGMTASGALLELRAFDQGTFATRLIPLPNFYDLGHAVVLKELIPLKEEDTRPEHNTRDGSGGNE